MHQKDIVHILKCPPLLLMATCCKIKAFQSLRQGVRRNVRFLAVWIDYDTKAHACTHTCMWTSPHPHIPNWNTSDAIGYKPTENLALSLWNLFVEATVHITWPLMKTANLYKDICSTVSNFVAWSHSGAVMHCTGYVEPWDAAMSILLSFQKKQFCACVYSESHCCKG
jgi:hypothetical protein